MRILIQSLKELSGQGGIETHGQELVKNISADIFVMNRKRNHSKEIKKEKMFGKNVFKIEYEEPWVSKEEVYLTPRMHQENITKRLEELKSKGISFDLVISLHSLFVTPSIKSCIGKVLFIMPSLNKVYFNKIKGDIDLIAKKTWNSVVEIEKEIMKQHIPIIVLSNFMRNQIKKNYPNNKNTIKVISPGIREIHFEKAKKQWDAILISRLAPEKNIKAFVSMARKLKDYSFALVGDGEERDKLNQLLKKNNQKNVYMPGGTDNVSYYYSRAKMFVLTSKYESFGLVLVEAMAFGLPCIAFRPDEKKYKTASDEIIKNGKTGFLVKDENEMVKKIELLLKDKLLLKKISQNAKKQSKEYSWKKHTAKLLKF